MTHEIISVTSDQTIDKLAVSQQTERIVQLVKDGEIDPLRLAVQLAAISDIIEQVRSGINDDVVAEIEKFGKEASVFGAKIAKREVGVKYDYSQSEAWVKIKADVDKVSDKLKSIEKIAKLVPLGTETSFTDQDTGDTYSIVSAAKSSKTSYAVTLSNNVLDQSA